MARFVFAYIACILLSGCISSVKHDDNLQVSVGDTLMLSERGMIYSCELHLSTISSWLAGPGEYRCLRKAPAATGEVMGERGSVIETIPSLTPVFVTKIQYVGMLDSNDIYVHLKSHAWKGRVIVREYDFSNLFETQHSLGNSVQNN